MSKTQAGKWQRKRKEWVWRTLEWVPFQIETWVSGLSCPEVGPIRMETGQNGPCKTVLCMGMNRNSPHWTWQGTPNCPGPHVHCAWRETSDNQPLVLPYTSTWKAPRIIFKPECKGIYNKHMGARFFIRLLHAWIMKGQEPLTTANVGGGGGAGGGGTGISDS